MMINDYKDCCPYNCVFAPSIIGSKAEVTFKKRAPMTKLSVLFVWSSSKQTWKLLMFNS